MLDTFFLDLLSHEIDLAQPVLRVLVILLRRTCEVVNALGAFAQLQQELAEGILRAVVALYGAAPEPLCGLGVVPLNTYAVAVALTELVGGDGITLVPQLFERGDGNCWSTYPTSTLERGKT